MLTFDGFSASGMFCVFNDDAPYCPRRRGDPGSPLCCVPASMSPQYEEEMTTEQPTTITSTTTQEPIATDVVRTYTINPFATRLPTPWHQLPGTPTLDNRRSRNYHNIQTEVIESHEIFVNPKPTYESLDLSATRMPFISQKGIPSHQSDFKYQHGFNAGNTNRRFDDKETKLPLDRNKPFKDRSYRFPNYENSRRYPTAPYPQNIFSSQPQRQENTNINSTNEKLTYAKSQDGRQPSVNKEGSHYPGREANTDILKPASNLPETSSYTQTNSTTSPYQPNYGYYNPYPSLTLYLGSHPQSFWNQWVRYRENASVYSNRGYGYWSWSNYWLNTLLKLMKNCVIFIKVTWKYRIIRT